MKPWIRPKYPTCQICIKSLRYFFCILIVVEARGSFHPRSNTFTCSLENGNLINPGNAYIKRLNPETKKFELIVGRVSPEVILWSKKQKVSEFKKASLIESNGKFSVLKRCMKHFTSKEMYSNLFTGALHLHVFWVIFFSYIGTFHLCHKKWVKLFWYFTDILILHWILDSFVLTVG